MSVKARVQAGDTITVRLPWSEVCMHMKVAGRERRVKLLAGGMAHILTDSGRPFSAPITAGEAGFYRDSVGWYVQRG